MAKCKSCGKRKLFINLNDDGSCDDCEKKMMEEEREYQKLKELHNRDQMSMNSFREVNMKHEELVEKIGQMYTVAINLMDMNSPEIDRLIAVCREDIDLLDVYRERWVDLLAVQNDISRLSGWEQAKISDKVDYWESYRRLAMIYEKRKEYQKAIDVCQEAIRRGITKDGSQGGFVGRAARMTKKLLSQNVKIEKTEDTK